MTSILSRPSADECAVDRPDSSLIIRVSRGAGTGLTRLAAFDHALRIAGVADFNLVRLSSVIPPGAEVVESEPAGQVGGGHGDLLYCVYADAYSSTPERPPGRGSPGLSTPTAPALGCSPNTADGRGTMSNFNCTTAWRR